MQIETTPNTPSNVPPQTDNYLEESSSTEDISTIPTEKNRIEPYLLTAEDQAITDRQVTRCNTLGSAFSFTSKTLANLSLFFAAAALTSQGINNTPNKGLEETIPLAQGLSGVFTLLAWASNHPNATMKSLMIKLAAAICFITPYALDGSSQWALSLQEPGTYLGLGLILIAALMDLSSFCKDAYQFLKTYICCCCRNAQAA